MSSAKTWAFWYWRIVACKALLRRRGPGGRVHRYLSALIVLDETFKPHQMRTYDQPGAWHSSRPGLNYFFLRVGRTHKKRREHKSLPCRDEQKRHLVGIMV